MDVLMPDGTMVTGVPEGTTKSDLMARYGKFTAAQKPAPELGLPSALPVAKPVATPPGPSSGVFGGDDVASQIFPVEAPAPVRKPSGTAELTPYEPSFMERVNEIFPGSKEKAANEYAARQIAEERGTTPEQIYKDIGGARPMFNPEGRAPVKSGIEAAGIVASELPKVPQAFVASGLQAIRAGDISAPEDQSWLDKSIAAMKPTKADGTPDKNYDSFNGLGESLGFSLATMTATAVAEAATAALTANPAAMVAAGMATSGTIAYRSQKDDFLSRVRDKLNANSQKLYGKNISQEDWNNAKEEYNQAATEYGLWEAVPEAISNAIFLKAFSGPAKNIPGGHMAKLLEEAGGLATENVTETITNLGQNAAELKAGLTEEEMSVADAFRQQFIQTMLISGVTAGGMKGREAAAQFYHNNVEPKIAPQTALGRAIQADLDSVGFSPESTRQEAVRRLSPDQAQMRVVKPEAGITSLRPAVAPAPPEKPLPPGETFQVTLPDDVRNGIQSGVASIDPDTRDFYALQLERKLAKNGTLTWQDIPQELNSSMDTVEFGALRSGITLNPEAAIALVRGDQNVEPAAPPVAEAPPVATPVVPQAEVAAQPLPAAEAPTAELARQVLPDESQDYEAMIKELEAQMEGKPAPKVEEPKAEEPKPAEVKAEEPAAEPARKLGLGESMEDYERINDDAVKMTREEFDYQHADDNYDTELWRAYRNDKISLADVEARAITTETGNKYFWAKTPQELEEDKKTAVQAAKGQKAAVNKLQSTPEFANWRRNVMKGNAAQDVKSAIKYYDDIKAVHKERVQEALDEGKPVPQEVLDAYKLTKAAAPAAAPTIKAEAPTVTATPTVTSYSQPKAPKAEKVWQISYKNGKGVAETGIATEEEAKERLKQYNAPWTMKITSKTAEKQAAAPVEAKAPVEVSTEDKERAAPYVQRFEAGNFSLPSYITGTGTEGRKVAEDQNKQASQDYAQAVKLFLEGPLTAKPPTKKQGTLNSEFVQDVSPQPIPKSIPAKAPTTFDTQRKALDAVMAKNDMRYYLNGTHIEPEKKMMVVTDGHRMALLKDANLEGMPEPIAGTTVIGRDDKWIPDTRFPDYNRVIPKEGRSEKMTVNAEDLGNYARAVAKAGKFLGSEFTGMPITDGNITSYVNAPYLADMADVFRRFGYKTFTMELGTKEAESILATSPDGKLVQVVMPMRSKAATSIFVPYDLTGGQKAPAKKAEPKVEKKVAEAPAEKPAEAAEPEMTPAQISAQLKKLMMESVRDKEPNAARDKEIDRLIKMQKDLEAKNAPPKPKEDIEALKAELEKLRDEADGIGPAAKKAALAAHKLEVKLERLGVDVSEKEEVEEPTENSPAYEKALEESRQASNDFAEVQRAYRAQEIGDEEFLAGRKVYDAAMAKFDEAYDNEQNIVQNYEVETPEGSTLRYPVAYNLVQDGYKVLALDDPRTYVDKEDEPHRTFEKGPLRIAMTPQKTLLVDRNAVQIGYGDSNEMVIEAIMVDQEKRGKGIATDAMQELVANADEHGVTLYIEPTPLVNIREKNFGLDKQQLEDFYKKFGFEFLEGTEKVMVREPQWEVLGPAEKPAAPRLGNEPYTIEGEFTEVAEAQQHQMLEGPISKLTETQTKSLEKEYGVDRDTTEFLDRVRKDVIDFVTKGAQAVHGKIRSIIRQLANGILSVAVVFNPQFVSKPYTIAVPQFDVRTSQVLADVPRAARAKMSDAAQRAYGVIYPAMEKTLKENDKFFIVADKRSGNTFFFNPDGSYLMDTKTLFGAGIGDFMKGDNEIVANRITPAGVFDLGLRDAKRSEGEAHTAGEYDFGKVFVLDKSHMGSHGPYSNTIMHSVWLHEKDAKQRLAALDKPGAEDSRYSFGCINVNKETFRNLVTNHLSQMDGAKIFIVPENGTNVMDFVNGKATYSEDIIRQRVEPVTKTTKTPVKETTKRERPGETLARTEEENIPLENVSIDQTKTPAFKKWFGNSQVVDANGKPLVMYHGTRKSENGEAFTYFDTYGSNYGLMGMGSYFTDNPEVASSYTKKGKGETPTVYPVYLSIKNALDMEAKADADVWMKAFPDAELFHEGGDTNESWYRAAEEAMRDAEVPAYEGAEAMQTGIISMGYDGITHIGGGRVNKADETRHRVYIAFEPNQIKSAIGNRGTFDVNDQSILANVERKLPPGRSPQLAAAAQMVQEGTMTAAEYDELVNFYKPIRKYEEPLKPATREEVYDALDSAKREKISPDIPNGTKVGLRLDIPAFNRRGVYVVSIHQKGTKSGPGKVIGYDSVALVNNVTFGLGRETEALKIAAGAAKDALQTIEGDYNKVTVEEASKLAKEALTDPAWVQIGIDPTRHSYFYDRETTEPVVAAEQVLQIGNMVLGKNVTYGNKADYLFNTHDEFMAKMDQYDEYLKTRQKADREEMIKSYAKLKARRGILTAKVIKGEATLTLQQELTQVSNLAKELRESIEDSKPERRTAGNFDTDARVALDKGVITQEVYDVIQAAYTKFPALLEGLKFSTVKEENKGTIGQFLPIDRIVRLYKKTAGTSDPVTVEHELTHSLEQMMDAGARNAVITAWENDLKAAMKKYTAEKGFQDHEDYFKAVMRFMQNPTMDTFRDAQALLPNYEMYQYLNPSEYWAVNAQKLMGRRLGSRWDRFVNIVKRLFEGLKKVLGFDNKYVVHKIFADIVSGDMKRLNKSSLVNYVANSRNISLENLNYKGGPAPLAQWTSPDESKMDTVIYKLQDKLVDTKRVIESIKQSTGQIAESWDAYMKEELYHGRTAKAVNDFLTKDMVPILEEMKSKGITLPQLDEYLHNRHAEERNDQIAQVNPAMPDAGSGIATADAQAYLANLTPEQRRDFGSIAAKIDAIVHGTQNLLVNTGLETQDTIDKWNQTYSNYVPLMRADLDFVHHGSGMGSGFGTKGKFSKRATGSYKDVVDIFANIALQRERAIIRSEKARVGRALYGLAITAPNPGFWLPVNPAAIKNKQKLVAELVGMGLSPADAANLIMEPKVAGFDKATGLVKYQVNPAMRSSDNVFPVRINGEDRFIFFNTSDPRALRMVEAMKNLDAEQLGLALGTVGQVTRWIAAVNTQYNPVFGAWNFVRDTGGAAFNLSTTEIAGKQKEVMKGVFPALFGIYGELRGKSSAAQNQWSQLFDRYQNAGGQTGFKEQFSKGRDKASIVERELKKLDKGNVKKATAAVFNWLSDYNDAMENAVRLSAFKVALDQNLSEDKAASIAKNLTVNFNRKGAASPIAQALYAFFNASVQGTVRVGQVLTGPAGKKIIAGGIALGVIQAIALAMAGFDDDEPPDFLKDKNLILPVGDGSYVFAPMPPGYNIFPGLGRLMTEYVLGQAGLITGAKGAGSKIASAASLILDAFNPLGSGGVLQVLAPTVIDPIAAIASNRDAFGRPISKEDRSTNPTPGYTRSRENASAFSQALAEFLNYVSSPLGTKYTKGAISPTADQLDYLIGQYTGGVGREIVKASEYISSKFTGEEVQPHRVPVVGKLYGETQSSGAISAKFYENVTHMAEHENEIKSLAKHRESAAEYKADNPDWRFMGRANYLENQVSAINAQKKALRERGGREEQIKRLDERKTAMMKKFNDDIKKAQVTAAQ
jgi:GNAT superfamily N-acetyltransferase/cation transport regulator ChaC